MIHTGLEFAENALLPKWERYTYDKLDCQAFVEDVLKDIEVRKPDGTPYNWRGSNSMYRNYYSWRGSVEECKRIYGDVPVGAFVYVWDKTGEEDVGYHDGLGNAKHVGIYCGNDVVRDSTRYKKGGEYVRNGPGTTTLKNFNKVTLFSGLDYNKKENYNAIEIIMSSVDRIRKELTGIEEALYAIRGDKTTA